MPGSADLPTSSDNSGGVATVSVADAQADVAAAQVGRGCSLANRTARLAVDNMIKGGNTANLCAIDM